MPWRNSNIIGLRKRGHTPHTAHPENTDIRTHYVHQSFAQEHLEDSRVLYASTEPKRDNGFVRKLAHGFDILVRTRFVEPQRML